MKKILIRCFKCGSENWRDGKLIDECNVCGADIELLVGEVKK